MAELRGRQFGFLGLLCTTWIAARVGFLTFAPDLAADVSATRSSPVRPVIASTISPTDVSAATQVARTPCCNAAFLQIPPPHSRKPFASRLTQTFIGEVEPSATTADLPLAPLLAAASDTAIGPALILQPRAQTERRLRIYAYSFWRSGSQGPALASGAQYGGSQSGLVGTYALGHWPNREEKLAILLRGAVALESLKERELAAGLRWRPMQKLPVTLSAERRFRANRPDAFAAYLAGGVSDVSLPLKFRLEGYAQGGFVSGKDGGAFFDFLARTDRAIAAAGTATISGGAGAWGGGQDNVRRLDIGPTMRADIAIGDAQLRLSADWRFRVAGDAKPGHGPAVTLSTSF